MLPRDATRIHDIIEFRVRHTPDAEAAVDGELRLTYSQLAERVDGIARALLAAGVGRGDHVATLAPPCVEFWLSCLATVSIGAVWQGVNPRHKKPEFAYQLDDSKPKVVFARSPFDGRDYSTEVQEVADHVATIVAIGEPTGRAVDLDTFVEGGRSIDAGALRASRDAVDPEDIAVIVYTSGTTGRPKGAMLSHRAIVQLALDNAEWMGEGLECSLMAAPIDHIGGLNHICVNVTTYGGRLVFYPRVDMVALGELAAVEQPTLMVASPTSLMMMLSASPDLEAWKTVAEEDVVGDSGIRLTVTGGAATPQNILEVWEKACPNTVSVYGQTETTGIITRTDPGASMADVAETIGRPVGRCIIRIAREDGTECDIGETGEIQVAGPYVMSGYLNRPEATAEAFTPDGYLRTGDRGLKREDDNLVFVGRLNEMYKSGGYNIYPPEIEQALCEHPNVLVAAVLPVPHELYQEVGHAFVTPVPGETVTADELDAFLRERLANYKIPKAFTIEAEMPTLPNTKIDKRELKRRLEKAAEK